MRITIELDPADVKRFEEALERARRAVRSADESDLIGSAKQALATLSLDSAPGYVRERIARVGCLVEMLEDEDWALPKALRGEIVKALVYFSDPEDLIPDHLPVIGLLDDAIMLELLLRQERDILRAYDRFCAYRDSLGPRPDDFEARKAWCKRLRTRRNRLIEALDKRARN
jgi:uncharacterized membrane protein YkvA (DUF1232 family)